ncbi:MAG TPA: hypothetical protein VKY65_21660 [Alphaproteobacteria bacterium]|nr:hypothetical protein [Alphaproteobacteria bacterium]
MSITAPDPRRAPPSAALPRTIGPDDVAACSAELYAYVSVGALAEQLGPDADVFDAALNDLHDQLQDCLTAPAGDLLDVKWTPRADRQRLWSPKDGVVNYR